MTQRQDAVARRVNRRQRRFVAGARQLSFEGLEGRQLMAGNVTAAVRGQTLVITGDAAANNIAIVATDNDRYAVIGIDTNVNRSEDAFVTTRAIRNIQVSLNGGDDVLLATSDATGLSDVFFDAFELDLADRDIDAAALQGLIDDVNPAESFSVPGNLTILGGQGGDVVGIVGSVGGNVLAQLSDFGTDAANFFAMDGLAPPVDEFSVGGGVLVTGGGQNDSVAVANARIQGRLAAELGNGANVFVTVASQVGTTFTYTGGAGADIVATGDVDVGSSMAVVTRGGSDEVYTAIDTVGDTRVGRSLSIDTGLGDDTVGVSGTTEVSVVVNTGDGNDEISVIDTIAGGNISIMAGAGNDLVDVQNIDVNRVFQAALGLGNDVLTGSMWIVNQSVYIDGGPGDDDVTLEDLAVEQAISVVLGSGNDNCSIMTSTALSIFVSGGAGTDNSAIDDETRDVVANIFESSIEP